MVKSFMFLAFSIALLGAGWIAGSIYPAPEAVTGYVRQESSALLDELDPEAREALKRSLSPQEFERLTADAADLAAAGGAALIVERVETSAIERTDGAGAMVAADAIIIDAGATAFETSLKLCPGMRVANGPTADRSGVVKGYARFVEISGVSLAVNPTRGACLSSGFGARGGSVHKGVDYHAPDGGPILAAAAGVVLEKKYRDDYGNMLLIDHGNGVHTRYAHLSSFARGVEVGVRVEQGQEIGLMGNTAAYRIPVHLHYEVLVGDYANPKGSFGLAPRSPFGA